MSADLCFTTDYFLFSCFLLFLLLSFFVRTKPKPVTCSEVSAVWKCMSKMWGAPKRYRSLTTTLTADIFGMKHAIHKRASALQTTRSLLHRLTSQNDMNNKRLQIGGEFSPTLRNYCISLHCQASQMEISKRNSTKLCQTVDGKSR